MIIPVAPERPPGWIGPVLRAAALYNLLWGSLAIFSPGLLFQGLGMEPLNYPEIWQALGLVVGLYGLGYWIAARDPFRHWPIVLVGFLGKVLGPIGFLVAAIQGRLPWTFGWNIVGNDLIWWVPFAAILYHAFRWNSNPALASKCPSFDEAIRLTRSQRGETLEKLSFRQLTMVIFLRHSGCTFCRETLSDLQKLRDQFCNLGVSVAIVHMGNPMEGTKMLARYELDHMHHFSDPHCRLYRAFGLERGRWSQLFSWKVLRRGWQAGVSEGHGIGKLAGDSFQLPGVFFLHEGRIVLAFPTHHAAERFDYQQLLKQAFEALQKTEVSRERVAAQN